MSSALSQTRELMTSKLPEYRPFALQEIVRAATLQGGDAVKETNVNPLNVPAWLDIFLYCVTAFVIGVAIFIGLYANLVDPYKVPDPESYDMHKLTLSHISNVPQLPSRSEDLPVKKEQRAHMNGNNVMPPQPPPPPPPMLPL